MLIQFPGRLLAQPVERWTEWFFARPASPDGPDSAPFDAESDWLDESDSPLAEEATSGVVILERVSELHERYAECAGTYSAAQLSQGLWAMFSFPCYLGALLSEDDLPLSLRARALRSLIVPYRVYVKGWNPDEAMPHGWDMLWDLVLSYKKVPRDVADVALECLREILSLDDLRCQAAALHGLNHLDHPDRAATVQRWDRRAPRGGLELGVGRGLSRRQGNVSVRAGTITGGYTLRVPLCGRPSRRTRGFRRLRSPFTKQANAVTTA